MKILNQQGVAIGSVSVSASGQLQWQVSDQYARVNDVLRAVNHRGGVYAFEPGPSLREDVIVDHGRLVSWDDSRFWGHLSQSLWGSGVGDIVE